MLVLGNHGAGTGQDGAGVDCLCQNKKHQLNNLNVLTGQLTRLVSRPSSMSSQPMIDLGLIRCAAKEFSIKSLSDKRL